MIVNKENKLELWDFRKAPNVWVKNLVLFWQAQRNKNFDQRSDMIRAGLAQERT